MIILRGSSNIAFTGTGQTLTLPVTTNAGDCIVFATSSNGTNSATASGAGATWVNYTEIASAPGGNMCIGYNCSAGQTTCTVTLAGTSGSIVVAVFSGCTTTNPITSETSTESVTSPVTTSSLSYSTGNIVLAMGATSSVGWATGIAWGDGRSNNNIANYNNAGRPVSLDFNICLANSSTTVAYNSPNSGTQSVNVIIIVLKQATNSNFLTML